MENGTADSSSANGPAAAEGGKNAALSRKHTISGLKSAVHVAHGAAELGDLAKTLGAVAVKEAEVELRGLFHHRGGANTAEYIVSVSRHKVTVGSSFIHEKHGLGKLSEITQNGDFVMIFDSGDSHTYQPKSIYKLRPVSEAQLKKMKASADGKGGGKGGGKKMFNDLQERMELYRTLMSGKSVTIATDATVEEVIAEHATKILGKKEAAKSGAGAEGEKKELAIRQAGVLVNSHRWSTLQYHCHPRLGSVTVLLQVEMWGETVHATFMCRAGRTCAPLLLHGGVGAVGNYRDDQPAKKGAAPLAWFLTGPDGSERRFRDYFVQSSHNTYILGRQLQVYGAGGRPVKIVWSEAMPIALNLGYRVLELDVWGSSGAVSQIVRHGPTSALSNAVPLREMLEAVEKWMQRDEAADSARLRLPLTFSIENNHSTDKGELEMAQMFRDVFRQRLLAPAQFVDPTLREVASERRRVVIKSCSWKGADTVCSAEWAEIVAMWKPVAHPLCSEALVCKSVDAPSRAKKKSRKLPVAQVTAPGGEGSLAEASSAELPGQLSRADSMTSDVGEASQKAGDASNEGMDKLGQKIEQALAKVAEKRAKQGLAEVPTIIRVYPPAAAQNSENYDPTGAFDAHATITALNVQGRGRSGQARLSAGAMRGGLAPVADRCDRDKARSLEAIFVKHGYDGYMPVDAWDAGARADFLKKLKSEARGSAVGTSLLRWAAKARHKEVKRTPTPTPTGGNGATSLPQPAPLAQQRC